MKKTTLILLSALILLLGSLAYSLIRVVEFRNKANNILSNTAWENFTTDVLGAEKRPEVVLFGDSQVAFWPISVCWGALGVKNRGICGDISITAVGRFVKDVVKEHPLTCIIEIGTNDIAHNTQNKDVANAIDSMIILSQIANIRPIVCSILPTTEENSQDREKTKIFELNNILNDLCLKRNVKFVDLYNVLADQQGYLSSEYSKDGLHISRKAYIKITNMLFDVIRTCP